MITIYHNETCSKSSEVCNLLHEKKTAVKIIDYLATPLAEKELTELLAMLEMKPSQLIRKNEPIFTELYEGRPMMEADYLQALLEYPILMERPIVVKDDKAIIARPPEKVLGLL